MKKKKKKMRKTANACLLLRGIYYVTLTATREDRRRGETSRSPPLNSVGAGKTPCSSKQRLRVHHGISAHVRHDNI